MPFDFTSSEKWFINDELMNSLTCFDGNEWVQKSVFFCGTQQHLVLPPQMTQWGDEKASTAHAAHVIQNAHVIHVNRVIHVTAHPSAKLHHAWSSISSKVTLYCHSLKTTDISTEASHMGEPLSHETRTRCRVKTPALILTCSSLPPAP